MKAKTEIENRTDHYLVKLRETIHNSQQKIKLERDDQLLESVVAMIGEAERTENTAIQKQLIATAHILAKSAQVELIDLMIKNFRELTNSEAQEKLIIQGLNNKRPDENPLLSKFWGSIEDSINYFSAQVNEDISFIKRLEEAKNWLEKSEPNQEMELDDFNDLINTYAIIREKKNGGFSAAKATDFSSGDNINQSNEHKKSLTELTSELAQFSEQYVLQVSAIITLRQEFEEKIALVRNQLDKQVFLSPYNSLLQQVEEVIGEREKEFMVQTPHSIEQLLKQITITKNAQLALNEINEKLIEFLVSTLNPAIELAEKNRVDHASYSVSAIKFQLTKLRNLFKKCTEDPTLNYYLKIDENSIQGVLNNSDSIINKLSREKLTNEQIETKADEAINNLGAIIRTLDGQINRVTTFIKSKAELETQLSQLENERKEYPLAEIYGNDFKDLGEIRASLQKEENICYGIPKRISEDIVTIKNQYEYLKKEYTERSNSPEVIQLNNLLSAIDTLKTSNNTPDWVETLKSELEEIRLKYLASKINREEFKSGSAKAITTNVTETEVRQLTNNHESATHFGNFFRALAEFIVAIGYSIKGQEKPLYRPQFFASHQENVIAGKLNETYKLLKITEDAENQLSKSMLNN
ncbi:hypothetical protein [Legionella sainthelensi]|uniref:Uncharacterized protein n=1 Tax=Legionella sainthelensi TaxID=28087 RepID=A0A2H5FQR4_9GAMM|nr:hypothetical protein [Legionella sainthelensi]AUH73876.1 hypothetical protein CAB17_00830 [Legionella sainthelensi]